MADTVDKRLAARTGRAASPRPGRLRAPAALPPSRRRPACSASITRRQSAGMFIRRHKLAPYLLLLPALVGIGLVLVWPTIQLGLLSFQNFGLGQLSGTLPTQWVGLSNFTATLSDPEFWLALRITVLSAAVVVALTMLVGTRSGCSCTTWAGRWPRS